MLIKNIIVSVIFGAVSSLAIPFAEPQAGSPGPAPPPAPPGSPGPASPGGGGTGCMDDQPTTARYVNTTQALWTVYSETTYGIEPGGSELALSYLCPDLDTCISRAEAAFGSDCTAIAWVDYSPDPGVCYMRTEFPVCLPLLNDGGIRHLAKITSWN